MKKSFSAIVACTYLYGLLVMAGGCTPTATPPAPAANSQAAHDDHAHDDHDHDHDTKLPDAHELDEMHDDHVHATSYNQSVEMLETMLAEARAAKEKDDHDALDNTVHGIGHALEDVNGLAEKASLDAAAKEKIAEAVETLMDAFTKVDDKLHGGKGADLADVESAIAPAMDTLKSFKK